MSINGKWTGFERDDFAIIADRFNVGRWKSIIGRVITAVEGWKEFAETAGLEERERDMIGRYINTNATLMKKKS